MSARSARTDLVRSAYLDACRLDVEVCKPGNVYQGAPGHGMHAEDFRRSAEASAEVIARPGLALGERIRRAVSTSWECTGCNTNLGIVLLCAPLAQAFLARRGADLSRALRRVLAGAGVEDAEQVYAAIRLAAPGGLGRSDAHDVHAPVRVRLVEAMADAAGRDRIARQYSSGFQDVLGVAASYWTGLRRRGLSEYTAVADLYLFLLARFPDSHVQRKHGAQAAMRLASQAQATRERIAEAPDAERATCLARLDDALKRSGINPGTTADLTVATVFSERLRDAAALDSGVNRRQPGRHLRLHLCGASLISTLTTSGDNSKWL